MYNVTDVQDLVGRYFSSDLWQWTFVASVIYLFFRLNVSGKRAFIGAALAIILFINTFVIESFTALGENKTFYRHLWAIPTVVVIGIAMVDLVRILPNWFLKIPAFAAIVVFLWFANHEYIRCRIQIVSYHAKMVSEDVIKIGDELETLRAKSGKNVIFLVCPSAYTIPYGDMTSELQLYSGIVEITGASVLSNAEHNGEAELTGDNPDVAHIMSTCCSRGIDYVIVARNENAESIFREHGYEPVVTSDSFVLYPCYGYAGYVQDKINGGQLSYKSYHDEDGNLKMQVSGYSTVRYLYDRKGNKVEELFYDTKNELCTISSGYARKKYEYNDQRRCIKESFLSKYGDLCNLSTGYAEILKTYTLKGLLKSEKYNDKNGDAVLTNGCYETIYNYDSSGRLDGESYYDENMNPMNSTSFGFASKQITYDGSGNKTGEIYYDLNGDRIASTLGYASYTIQRNSEGRIICEQYLDAEGNIIGEVREGIKANNNLFSFFHCSNGASIKDDELRLTTSIPDNRFHAVRFQIFNAETGEYHTFFGETISDGQISGQFIWELPTGMYSILLKGNSNLHDEYISCMAYIENGWTIEYDFIVDELSENVIQVSNAKLKIE